MTLIFTNFRLGKFLNRIFTFNATWHETTPTDEGASERAYLAEMMSRNSDAIQSEMDIVNLGFYNRPY